MPRADGRPTIAEMNCEHAIEEVGKTGVLDAATVLAELRAKLGYEPDASDIAEHVGVDPRADKPWPEAEDCAGCDKHMDGPHRFGCKVHGKRQPTIVVDKP